MIGLSGENLLEDGPGLQLAGIGLVGMFHRLVNRQGIEDRRLRIIGMSDVELFHRALVGLDSLFVSALLGIAVVGFHRRYVLLLPGRLRSDRLGLCDGLPPTR